MVLLIITGTLAIFAGIVFFSGEKNVRKVNSILSNLFNKTIARTDEFFLRKRIGTGICLILIGLFCLFIAYWIRVMAPPGFKIF